ncbi:MAG: carbohydrate-binding family 9-like protein [Bacteroidales bacterium]|nr:carbohydrate-binding family 9-like protein [Bacteroidales bacterium]
MKKKFNHFTLPAIIITSISLVLFITSGCKNENTCIQYYDVSPGRIKIPGIEYGPEKYVCYRAEDIVIDAYLDEESWMSAEWTNDFVDIEGALKPLPLHRTRAKMLWDDSYLYIAAELIEPHIWAKLRQRDTVIFYDNDFEVFIDPDGDSHEYMEFEMNAINTLWDLLLTKPYRDGGRVSNAWDIKGIKTAVKVYGTINDPADLDDKWVLELALPLDVLTEFGDSPQDGTQWRINFSRVNWRTQVENGNYIKTLDPETGKTYPEYNWVWSPQGVINMHYPEKWGYLQFSGILSGKGKTEFVDNADELLKWNLRTLYYAQRNYADTNKLYTADIKELYEYGYEEYDKKVCILLKPFGYEAYMLSDNSNLLWIIDNHGKIYSRITE